MKPNPLGIPDTPPDQAKTLLYTAMGVVAVLLIVQGGNWLINILT